MNVFQDNYFDFRPQGDLRLHYCGWRERSVEHRYVHRQAAYLITYVCEGEAQLTVGEETVALTAGDVYVLFPSSGASYVTAPAVPWSIRWVTLTGGQLESLVPSLGFTPAQPVVKAAEPARVERLLESLFRLAQKEDMQSKLSGMALLYDLLSCIARHTAPSDNPAVADAVRYITRHYTENITVHGLADRAFLNNNYFSKLFTAQVGVTPQQFLLRTRMEKAKELLTYTELTVGEIAAAVGVSDALYFSRAFRRYSGTSPSGYRKQNNF